jgi:type IV pilus assembly protein PilV
MTVSISRKQAGAGLIEVMIAVFILAIGMLGIAALQSITLRNVGSSAGRTQAVMQTYAMLDTLRAQKTTAIAGTFNTAGAYQCSTATALGTPGTLDGWLADLRQTVGTSACGLVNCTAGGDCTIGVQWNEERATGGSTAQTVTTTSKL